MLYNILDDIITINTTRFRSNIMFNHQPQGVAICDTILSGSRILSTKFKRFIVSNFRIGSIYGKWQVVTSKLKSPTLWAYADNEFIVTYSYIEVQ